MLPPIGERRVDAPEDEPGRDAVTPPAEPTAKGTPGARAQTPTTRDLVALYAARADATAVDLRPLIDARRERRATAVAPVFRSLPAVKPRPVGRGTAEHRNAVRAAGATNRPAAPRRVSGDRIATRTAWRRWLPTVGVAKLAMLVSATIRGVAGPRKRGRPRARRAVQGRA
jgi:hypothetical protein